MRLASSGDKVDSIGCWLVSPSLMLSYIVNGTCRGSPFGEVSVLKLEFGFLRGLKLGRFTPVSMV